MPFSLGLIQTGRILKQQQPVNPCITLKASCFRSPLSFLSLLTTCHEVKCQLQSLWNKRGGGRQEPPELLGDTGDNDLSKLPAACAGPRGHGLVPNHATKGAHTEAFPLPLLVPKLFADCVRGCFLRVGTGTGQGTRVLPAARVTCEVFCCADSPRALGFQDGL